MPNNDFPEPLQETIRRATAAMANTAGLQNVRQRLAEIAMRHNQVISDAIQRQQAVTNELWSRQISDLLARTLESRQARINEVLAAYGRTVAAQVAEFDRLFSTVDVSGMSRVLEDLDVLHDLNEDARRAAERALQDAFTAAQSGASDDVSDEMVASAEEAARDFAAAGGRSLSPEAQRNAFVWFCGVIVFLWLMQAMVTSEAAKELIEDAATVAGPTALAMVIAGKGWDRVFPPTREEDGAGGE